MMAVRRVRIVKRCAELPPKAFWVRQRQSATARRAPILSLQPKISTSKSEVSTSTNQMDDPIPSPDTHHYGPNTESELQDQKHLSQGRVESHLTLWCLGL